MILFVLLLPEPSSSPEFSFSWLLATTRLCLQRSRSGIVCPNGIHKYIKYRFCLCDYVEEEEEVIGARFVMGYEETGYEQRKTTQLIPMTKT